MIKKHLWDTTKALPIVTKVQRSKIQPTSGFLGTITSFGLLSSRSTYCKTYAGSEKTTTRAKNQTGIYCPTHVAHDIVKICRNVVGGVPSSWCLFITFFALKYNGLMWKRIGESRVDESCWQPFCGSLVGDDSFASTNAACCLCTEGIFTSRHHSHSHEGFAVFWREDPESWKIGCVFAVIRVVFSADHFGTLPAENPRNHNPWNWLWLRSLYFWSLYFCYNRKALSI